MELLLDLVFPEDDRCWIKDNAYYKQPQTMLGPHDAIVASRHAEATGEITETHNRNFEVVTRARKDD
ncbi:hypothetical protein FOPG_18203 [Fusarium oxysporum f. sp. conglutinans race 2 54008]|uniref:Uncharacterized protein n=1 Tax=Fusarium oxysporum f. sp. conglutinans race 2 54008 TaxID=1089457 RepID=X0H0B4_FUSOX|nr:hypothetical protein FOPG_18203 [Fusarium oxysporum f. sp. conglutinans race 2 54008]